MKLVLYILLAFLMFSPARADESEAFDHSKFYETKIEIQNAIQEAVRYIARPPLNQDKQIDIQIELTTRLMALQTKGYQFTFDMNAFMLNETSMYIVIKPTYEDAKGKITWEMVTVTNGDQAAFFTRINTGEAESIDDYYRYGVFVRQ